MVIRRLVLLALLAVLIPVTAVAQPSPGQAGTEDPLPEMTEKSPYTAVALSLGGTAVSAGLVIAGMTRHDDALVAAGALSSMITPSLGEWYAGHYLTSGLGLRAIGGLAIAVGVSQGSWSCTHAVQCPDNTGGWLLVGMGALAYGGGVVYDIVKAPAQTHHYNTLHVMLAPAIVFGPQSRALGVGFGGDL